MTEKTDSSRSVLTVTRDVVAVAVDAPESEADVDKN
jgi:hypothetical protein